MEGTSDIPFTSFAEGYGDDPPAAVLTKAQREYVLGERELETGVERATQRRIRQRIPAALWDLALLAQVYPEDELEKVRPDAGERTLPTDALAAMLYRFQPKNATLAEDLTEGERPGDRDRPAAWVEGDVSRGIEKVIKTREKTDAEVNTAITVDRGVDLEALAEGELAELSRDQLDTLLITGEVTREEYAKANEKRLSK